MCFYPNVCFAAGLFCIPPTRLFLPYSQLEDGRPRELFQSHILQPHDMQTSARCLQAVIIIYGMGGMVNLIRAVQFRIKRRGRDSKGSLQRSETSLSASWGKMTPFRLGRSKDTGRYCVFLKLLYCLYPLCLQIHPSLSHTSLPPNLHRPGNIQWEESRLLTARPPLSDKHSSFILVPS